ADRRHAPALRGHRVERPADTPGGAVMTPASTVPPHVPAPAAADCRRSVRRGIPVSIDAAWTRRAARADGTSSVGPHDRRCETIDVPRSTEFPPGVSGGAAMTSTSAVVGWHGPILRERSAYGARAATRASAWASTRTTYG